MKADFNLIRKDFRALEQNVRGFPLSYLDTAASALKPEPVVEALANFYRFESSNVHRGAHFLSHNATVKFEAARETVKNFVGAASSEEIVFTKGTTESINLVVSSYGPTFLKAGDEILLTELEHHANLVPWQNLAREKNLVLKFLPVLPDGSLDESKLSQFVNEKTRVIAFSGCSNTTGAFSNIDIFVEAAKKVGAVTLVDAAQLITQKMVDVQKLNVDFLVFSGHKLFGPYGIGVLYGKKAILEKMPPYQFGGSMISTVTFQKSEYNVLPHKFEAGTPMIAEVIGLAEAIRYFSAIEWNEVQAHETELYQAMLSGLKVIPEIQIFGTTKWKAPILSFNLAGAHHSDVGQILDQMGVAVRVGHHCTQPLLQKFGLTGSIRASISIYNNLDDIHRLIEGLLKAKRMLL